MSKYINQKTGLLLAFIISVAVALAIGFFDRDFGINLLTEIAGVALTVFIINRILENRERQKRISIDQRIVRELQSIIASYYSIWKHITWHYMPGITLKDERQLMNVYTELLSMVKITDRFQFVTIHHPESWDLFFNNRTIKDCFQNYHETLRKQIQRFIDDFKIYIEPDLLDILLNIMDCQYFKEISLMGMADTRSIVIEYEQDPDKLDSYLRADDRSHMQYFMDLLAYSSKMKDVISKFSTATTPIYKIEEYFKNPSSQFT
ncbi:MAG TPA: hypothetical protein VD927_01795 [Chryseosolibacter sp.]|nr:hypothetical protein [Chryseosolibacter sp.]